MLKRACTLIVSAVIPLRLGRVFAVTAVVMCATAPVPANASTIFSNLASSAPFFDVSSTWLITDETSEVPDDFDQGGSFTPSADYTLDSITVAFSYFSGTNAFDLWLMSDSAGVPGAIIETFGFTNVPGSGTLLTAASVLNPVLSAGTPYWLIASAQGDGALGWHRNNTGDQTLALRANDGIFFVADAEVAPAFQVEGTPLGAAVPEPASLTLLGVGLAGAGVRRWRQRRRG